MTRAEPARLTAPLALALLTACTLAGCKKLSDEDQVRAVVHKAIDAANEKKAGGVVADAGPGFKGPQGADVNECRRILVGWFLQQGWIRAFERRLDVEVEGDHANAKLETVLAKGREVKKLEDVVPTDATVLEFSLELKKLDGAWKFISASYKHAM